MDLESFIATKVKDGVSESLRDRDLVETESAIRVFERAWGWVKIVGGIAAVLLAILGAGVFWKVSDWWKSVDLAKQTVTDTANETRTELSRSAGRAVKEIDGVTAAAENSVAKSTTSASHQVQGLLQNVESTKSKMAKETQSFNASLLSASTQLQAASKLQPEMTSMQQQLGKASADIKEQQKTLSSTQDFVKKVFSSHVSEYFNVGVTPERYKVISRIGDSGNSSVLILLTNAPIESTLQLQFGIAIQPPNSYAHIHNLVVFFWGDPPDNLKQKQLVASYFPDTSDTELIKTLAEKDGRIYADDQPLPKFGQPDPDFKGNKWIPSPKP